MKFKIFKFTSVTSTNDVALNLIHEEKKEIGYFDMLNPSGDLQKDLQKIQECYQSVIGKNPELYNSKIY